MPRMTRQQIQGVKQGLFALNVSPNTLLVLDISVIDPDVFCTDPEIGKWMHQRGICPSLICVIPKHGESLTAAIKTISIPDLEHILAEAKEARAKIITIGEKSKEPTLLIGG